MASSKARFAIAAVAAVALVHCYSGSSSTDGVNGNGGTDSATGPTFHKDVEPILQKNCQGCHAQGGIAPFALITYADAKGYAPDIVAQTSMRNMPPWGAQETADCTPAHGWKEDLRLKDADIATLKAWSSAGAPEGDPKDAPPALVPKTQGLANATHVLKPPAPYMMTSTTSDEFRCFVLDPMLTTAQYMNGSFFVAGNPLVVHHALLYSDPAGESKSKITDQTTQSYACEGGAGITQQGLLAAWAPGGVPSEYPSNIGAGVAANTLLVLQIHYHPHLSGPRDPDQTTVQLRFTSTKPEYNLVSALLGNFKTAPRLLPGPDDPSGVPEFTIPPNVTGHTESMVWTMPKVPVPVYVYGASAHMHYVGVSETVKAKHVSTASEECLLSVPRWDFSWQRGYAYDVDVAQLPVLASGDQVEIKCTYDNTMKNPKLAASLTERQMTSPIEVHLGESTLDEMCLAPLSLLYKN